VCDQLRCNFSGTRWANPEALAGHPSEAVTIRPNGEFDRTVLAIKDHNFMMMGLLFVW